MAYWTVKQLAQEMGLEERTIIQKIHKGEIEAKQLGGKGKWLISSSEIDRLLGRHKVREDLVSIVPSVFEQAHTKSVFNLLDAYARQLKVPYDPEDLFTLDITTITDITTIWTTKGNKLLPPEARLVFPPEIQLLFAVVEGHYKNTKLGEDVSKYKQAVDAYRSAGRKLKLTIASKGCLVSELRAFLDLLREVVRVELAPVRILLYLEGIETDRETIKTFSEAFKLSGKPLQQLLEFVSRYKDNMDEEGEVIIELLGRLQENYEIMKRLEKAIIRDIEEEKLKGILPPGTKCKFCPPAIMEEADSTIRVGAL